MADLDDVIVSRLSKLLACANAGGKRLPTEAIRQYNLADLKTRLPEAVAMLKQILLVTLHETGLDAKSEIAFRMETSQWVSVMNQHPEKRQIEWLFAGNTDLRAQLAIIELQSEIVALAEAHAGFRNAFDSDPWAALSQFREVFDTMEPNIFHLQDGAGSSP